MEKVDGKTLDKFIKKHTNYFTRDFENKIATIIN